jgi:heme-degrading monooxygenase HmoA
MIFRIGDRVKVKEGFAGLREWQGREGIVESLDGFFHPVVVRLDSGFYKAFSVSELELVEAGEGENPA